MPSVSLRLLTIVSLVLGVAATAGTGAGRAADPRDPDPHALAPHAAASPWQGKLDPFLRRLALGSTRVQGGFREKIPPLSLEALRTAPPFVRVGRREPEPILYVKARVADEPGGALEARELTARRLEGAGARVRGRVGPIVSLEAPASAIARIAALPEVAWLKSARSYALMNETSMGPAHVAARAASTTFMTGGAGVIVAVVDTGITYDNLDFRHPDGTTRVLGIWDQTITDPLHPPPAGFSFGAFYSRADIDGAIASGTPLATGDGHGHGTHVAGTAAGNGRATGNGVPIGTFAGAAPEADLLIVRVFDDIGTFCEACDLTAAVQFIQEFASDAGKPWVGNMSLGDDLGAHDGTAPDELAIDAAVGPGRPGSQMAIAAGNSAQGNFHWSGALAPASTATNTFNITSTRGGANNSFVLLDIWYEGEDDATVEIRSSGGITVSAARGLDSGVVCTVDGAIQIDATAAPDPANGDNEVFVQITDLSDCVPFAEPRTGTWTVRLVTQSVGPAGGSRFDLYKQSTVGVALFTITTAGTVSIPGTSRNALTAGSYISKTSWINDCGSTTATAGTVGLRSGFSGLGPTRDGRIKPDFAAPGQLIGSTAARPVPSVCPSSFSFLERDAKHTNFQGTSMATPHVAGTAALLLAINPALDGAEVRTALQRAARADSFTGAVPNNSYGYGKLRALEAGYQAAAMVTDLAASGGGGFSGSDSPFIHHYNVYRGAIPGISAANLGGCFLPSQPSPAFSDSDVPAAGQAFAYLVTGVYVDPTTFAFVEGSLGNDSTGRPRTNAAPCP